MDISAYISQLLYEHDCVIIPGLGGFVCNYKPADIHPIHHTIAPPSKAVSFNRNLKSNDGLLVNYIANAAQLPFDKATDVVNHWVNTSNLLLKKNEEIVISKVGRLFNDVESNLQFAPDESVNYLKASFGLRTITAEPVIRGKVIEFTEKFKQETKHSGSKRNLGRVAAIMLLLVSLIGIAELMWMGIEVKQLNLDEASVFNFLNRISQTPEPELKTLPIEIKNTNPVVDSATEVTEYVVDSSTLAENAIEIPVETSVVNEEEIGEKATEEYIPPIATSQPASAHTYYVMIGAFAETKNIEAAVARLQQRFPDSVILIEKGKHLTKLGYSVGGKFSAAVEKLQEAQQEDSTFWLLKK